MKKVVLLTFGLFLLVTGYAQRTADIGIWGGGSNYMGDLENQTFTTFGFPAAGAYFRYNLHYRASIRAMFLTGRIAGKGLIQGQEFRSQTASSATYEGFSKLFQDLTLQAEINFLRYMIGNQKAGFTSYLTAGVGVMYFPYAYDPVFMYAINPATDKGTEYINNQVIAATLPFGMGIKFNVGARIGFGLEYQMRKLFSDRLDNLDDPLSHRNADGYIVTYSDMFHNNDWAGFLGIHLTYKIYLGSKPCPAYDVKN
jgi:hypothetical protein